MPSYAVPGHCSPATAVCHEQKRKDLVVVDALCNYADMQFCAVLVNAMQVTCQQ